MNALLSDAFRLLREGRAEEALPRIRSFLENYPENFGGNYALCLALGLLGKYEEMARALPLTEKADYYSPLLNYLRAYLALRDKNLEKAVYEYTRIADTRDGWLAMELLSRLQKKEPLAELAGAGNFVRFVFLPGSPAPHESRHDSEEIEKEMTTAIPWKKIIFVVFVPAAITAVLATAWFVWAKRPLATVPDIQITATAYVTKNEKVLRKYSSRSEVLADFDLAKKHLRENRINDAIFLLQNVRLSNADFNTREKAKLLLSMIPLPDYGTFRNTLSPEDLYTDGELRMGSFVLWEGNLLKYSESEQGVIMRIYTGNRIAEAYFPFKTRERKSSIESLNLSRSVGAGEEKKIIFYAQFRGFIGNNRSLYLEVLELWK